MKIKRKIKKELRRCGYKNIVSITINNVYKCFRSNRIYYEFVCDDGLIEKVYSVVVR